MDYRNKLRNRIFIYAAISLCGIAIIAACAADAITSAVFGYGVAAVVIGAAMIFRSLWYMNNEKRLEEMKIKETDERTLMIYKKSTSAAARIYIILSLAASVLLYICGRDAEAAIMTYSTYGLGIIICLCRFVFEKLY